MPGKEKFRIAIRTFDPFESALKKLWDSFCKTEKVELEYEGVSLELHPLYESLFENDGLQSGDWDVVVVNTDWLSEANESGGLLNLVPYIENDPPEDFPDGWTDSVLRMQEFDGRIVGLPFHDGPECMIYRTDLFEDPAEQKAYKEQFGAELVPPRTWSELVQVARFFQRPKDNLYGTVFAAYPDGHNTVFDFSLQLWSRGGEILDSKTGRVQLDTPQAAAALEFYRDILNDTSAVHPDCRDMDSVKSGLAFSRGEIAMMANWFGFASMCETIPDSKVKGKVGIGSLPSGEGGSPVSLNVYWVLGVASGSNNKGLAYRFIRHCISRENDILTTLDGAIGCRRSTWTDPGVNKTIPFYHEMEHLHDNARELPRMSNWAQVAGVIDKMVLETINTKRPIKEILEEAQKGVDALEQD